MTCSLFEIKDICKSGFRREVRIAGDKAFLIRFYTAYHIGLILNRLGTIDKGDTALLSKSDCQLFTGNRLHDRRDHRDIHFDRAFFLALPVLDKRGFERDRCRNAFR